VPIVAAYVAVVCYWAPVGPLPDGANGAALAVGWTPFLAALAVAGALWAGAAWWLRPLTTASRADTESYDQALKMLTWLAGQLGIPDTLEEYTVQVQQHPCAAAPGCARAGDRCRELCDEALRARNAAVAALGKGGVQWVLASGYAAVWENLHAAEEAVIAMVPLPDAIDAALLDEQRLTGSSIATREVWLARLRRAVLQLSPTSAPYLAQQPSEAVKICAEAPPISLARFAWWRRRARRAQAAEATVQARTVVRRVRQVINQFRDDSYRGVIAARNRLLALGVLEGTLTLAVLWFAILDGIAVSTLNALAIYYLTGATVGIFNWWAQVLRADTAIEDYGLSRTRLIVTPIFAGMAAVAGILVTKVLGSAIADLATTSQNAIPSLESIYAFTPANLVIALTFGLTPSVVIAALQQQATRYLSGIKSTLATTGNSS
jgi:hypothetical protein